MDVTLAFATFAALFAAWILIARRRPALRAVDEPGAAGRPGFLRRLAG